MFEGEAEELIPPPSPKVKGRKPKTRGRVADASEVESTVDAIEKEPEVPAPGFKMSTASEGGAITASNPTALQAGDIISINLAQRKMIAIPGMKLNWVTPTTTIPMDIKPKWLTSLTTCLIKGDLIKGGEYVPAVERDATVIDEYVQCLTYPFPNFLKVCQYLTKNRHYIRGVRTSEIASTMIEKAITLVPKGQVEKYRKALEDVFEITGGVGPVTEAPVQNAVFKDPNKEEFPVPH